MLESPAKIMLKQALILSPINYQAKYATLIGGLCFALGLGVSSLQVSGDSQLVVSQIKEEYKSRISGEVLESANELFRKFHQYRNPTDS